MTMLGTVDHPLRVAIIGSGPSGFYAADGLLKHPLTIQIDMFERLPTPFGLVRGGVAPDHPKIKTVTKVYERTADHPDFRFYGNVTIGEHLTHDDLLRHYHAIIYAVGAQTDRQMQIPGEDLPGSHAATEFVGWYNGHPDYRHLSFDLTQERAAVVGNGNVAMDVARILASTYDELAKTDIADYALEALRESSVREIYILGRRGPAQAAFTNPEIRELEELAESDVIVLPEDMDLDALSKDALNHSDDRTAQRNVQTLTRYAEEAMNGKPRRIHMRFLVSPTAIEGDGHVERIILAKNKLQRSDDGSLRPRPTGETEVLPVGLVFRSIGYKGVPLAGVPFDERAAIIPNREGRVIDQATDATLPGEYVVGWIKRGPSGIIGTNKPDSLATVDALLADASADHVNHPTLPGREALEQLLTERQPAYITFADWRLLDAVEVERGTAAGRPRLKVSRVDEMLAIIADRKKQLNPAGD